MSYQHIWKHFEKLNDTEVKCKLCASDNIIEREFFTAKNHLIKLHYTHIEKDVLLWKNDTYPLWRHFSREDDWYIARCYLCGMLLTAIRQTIEDHLNRYHKEKVAKIQQKINHTWSQYFTFKNSYAYCKSQNCHYKVKMYRIDVLEFHFKSHDKNKCSGCEERAGDNNADKMIQQSVDEKSYAGSSSHDNIHPQSLGNQEDQQGSNVNNSGQSSSGQGFKSRDDSPEYILGL